MVDAPEKIWIEQDDCPYFYEESELTEVGSPVTEYTRSDLVAELEALVETLKREAQLHAQEARTANATIAEIYREVSGGKGEPGNWHGAEPVRAELTALRARVAELEDCRNTLLDALADLRQWADSYPLNIFPEPNFARAAKALADAGMTIDAISASNMRHVLSRVKTIADAALKGDSHEQG